MTYHSINPAALTASLYKQLSNLNIDVAEEQINKIVTDIFIDGDVLDYDGIKKKNGELHKRLKDTQLNGFTLTRTQTLNLIAKALGFGNHHILKTYSVEPAQSHVATALPERVAIYDDNDYSALLTIIALYQPLWDDANTLIIGPHADKFFSKDSCQKFIAHGFGSTFRNISGFRNATLMPINEDIKNYKTVITLLKSQIHSHNRIIINDGVFVRWHAAFLNELASEIKNKSFILIVNHKKKLDNWTIPKDAISHFDYKDILFNTFLKANVSKELIDIWWRNMCGMTEFFKIERCVGFNNDPKY